MSQILRKSSPSKIKSSFKLKREGDGEIRKMEKEMYIYVESLVKSCYTNDDQIESCYLYDSQIISKILPDNKERPNQVTFKENNKSKISELLNENFISEYKQVRTNLYYKLISRLQIMNQNKNSSNVGLNYVYFNQNSQNKAFYEKNNNNISFSAKNSPLQSSFIFQGE
jgi:hypothetical protein